MLVTVMHGIDDLRSDLASIPVKAVKDMRALVRDATMTGNAVAKDNARGTSGRHAKHYPRTFTWDVSSFYGFGAGAIVGEYGPEARGQGLLADILENGTRTSPPHGDLAKSADLIAPTFRGEARRLPDNWFW